MKYVVDAENINRIFICPESYTSSTLPQGDDMPVTF